MISDNSRRSSSSGGGEDNEKKRNREEHLARSRQWETVGSDDDENDIDNDKKANNKRSSSSSSHRNDSGIITTLWLPTVTLQSPTVSPTSEQYYCELNRLDFRINNPDVALAIYESWKLSVLVQRDHSYELHSSSIRRDSVE